MAPVRSDGGIQMNDHIPDATKMISDTPRMQSALLDHPDAGFAKIWQVGCDIERELNAANTIIKQQQLLNEENLRLQERIKRLEEALEAVAKVIGPLGKSTWASDDELNQAWELYIKAKEAKP
jgi:hypothetical protein